jgi:hypothetical protein
MEDGGRERGSERVWRGANGANWPWRRPAALKQSPRRKERESERIYIFSMSFSCFAILHGAPKSKRRNNSHHHHHHHHHHHDNKRKKKKDRGAPWEPE